MNNSNETFKKCYRCEIIQVIENFNKDKNRKGGLNSICRLCRKKYYYENLVKIKKYNEQNKDKISLYNKDYFQHNKNKIYESRKNRRKTDVNFRLICNTRRRIHHALNGKSKSISTKEILGIDIETYKKRIEWQMTPDMTWNNIQIDHVKPICLFDVPKDEELKEAFNWKNTQPLLKEVHSHKGIKFNFLDYQLQFIKAYQFIKLNEERFNENIH